MLIISLTIFLIILITWAFIKLASMRKGHRKAREGYVSNVTGPNTPKAYAEPSLVLFYMPGCTWCEKMMPAYNRLIQEYDRYNGVRIMKVSSEDPEWDLAVYDINSFPTVRFYPSGLQVPESHIEYHGDRSYADLVKFFLTPTGYWGNNPRDREDYDPVQATPISADAAVHELASWDRVGAAEHDALEQGRANEHFGAQWQFYEPQSNPDYLSYQDQRDFASMRYQGDMDRPNLYTMRAPSAASIAGPLRHLRNEYSNSQDLSKKAIADLRSTELTDTFVGNPTYPTGLDYQGTDGSDEHVPLGSKEAYSPESAPVGSQPSDLNPLQRQTEPINTMVDPYVQVPRTTFGYTPNVSTQWNTVAAVRVPQVLLPSWPAQNNEGYTVNLSYAPANNTNDYIRGVR